MAKYSALEDVRNGGLHTVPLYVYEAGRLSCTEKGKPYYYMSVTDGKEAALLKLYDHRLSAAKERFDGKTILADAQGDAILKIHAYDGAIGTEGVTPAALPERLRLADVPLTEEGRTVCLPLLVCTVGPQKESRNGKKYFTADVSDGKDSISIYVWNQDAAAVREAFQGKVAYFTIACGEYPKAAGIVPCTEYGVDEFVKSAPVPPVQMLADILTLTEEAGGSLFPLVRKIYGEHKEELLMWPGALKLHHSVHGGLLYHTWRMVRAAEALHTVYPSLDKGLLLCGAALHDIGKLKELSSDGVHTEFLPDGNLSGHILLGLEMTGRAAWEMGEDAPDGEELRLLKHMIASHHGTLENGSPVAPAIPEAMVLHFLDMTDSRMDMFESALADTEPGMTSQAVYALGGVHAYKRIPPKEEKEPDDHRESDTRKVCHTSPKGELGASHTSPKGELEEGADNAGDGNDNETEKMMNG